MNFSTPTTQGVFDMLKEVIAGLTEMELSVYKALIKSHFATGINSDRSDLQTDLRETFLASKVHPARFDFVLKSLEKKGLYQNVPWDGGNDHDYELKHIGGGYYEKVRTDIGSVICDEEITPEFFK